MAGGRPTTYTSTIGRKLCSLIVRDIALKDICARADMPSVSTVCQWLSRGDMGDERYIEFSKLYARARQASAEVVYSTLQKIEMRILAPRALPNPDYDAERAAVDKSYTVPEKIDNPDYLDPNAGRAAADIIKWRAARMRPDVYGDKIEVAHRGRIAHTHTHRVQPPDWMRFEIDEARRATNDDTGPTIDHDPVCPKQLN